MCLLFSGIDSLLMSDWARLEEVSALLEPFAQLTDVLQTDAQSISSILPSILDLECHLQQHQSVKTLTTSMTRDLHQRFQTFLQPDAANFNPIPAAACLLDPSLASALLDPELAPLVQAAKLFIVSICPKLTSPSSPTDASGEITAAPVLKRFKFLAHKRVVQEPVAAPSPTNNHIEVVIGQLNRYLAEISEATECDSLAFWASRRSVYGNIASVAEDLLTAPASQAYVERIFSLCGLLTAGRRNRLQKSLEMRAFLKLNMNIL